VHANEVVVPTAALILAPRSVQSGESLEGRVAESSLVETHADLAEGLLPWVIGPVVDAGVLLWRNFRECPEKPFAPPDRGRRRLLEHSTPPSSPPSALLPRSFRAKVHFSPPHVVDGGEKCTFAVEGSLG
jgi:hypothetical protein